jgi:hypothetical protein
VSSHGSTPAISINPAVAGVSAGSMSAAQAAQLADLTPTGFAKRQVAFRQASFSVPVFVAFAGSPTATLNGTTTVVMSGNVTVAAGDLLFFGNGSQFPPFEVATGVTAGTTFTLTTPASGGAGVAAKTIPVGDAWLTGPSLIGLSAAGWTANVQGQVAVINTKTGASSLRSIVIYVSGSVLYQNGFIFYADLGDTGTSVSAAIAATNIPFNLDLVASGSVPTSLNGRVFVYATSGSSGDVEAATYGNSFMSLTQVG